MTIDSSTRRSLPRAAIAIGLSCVAVGSFAGAADAGTEDATGSEADSVQLLEDAIDAISDGDEVAYDAIVSQALSGTPWLPLSAVDALDDEELEDILLWSQVLDGDDDDVLESAYDVIDYEREGVAVIDELPAGDSTTPQQTQDINDADLAGAGVLELIDRRGITIPDSARFVLSPTGADGLLPTNADYELALRDLDGLSAVPTPPASDAAEQDPAVPPATDLATDPAVDTESDTAIESDVVPPAELEAPAEPTPDPEPATTRNDSASSLPLIIALALGGSALALGLVGAFRGRKTDQLADIAFTDGLTGLNNRRRLDADVSAQRDGSERTTASLMVDVDHFKQFNDTHGHAVGDEVLRLVGAALDREFRKSDVPYRYGGEEFCILLHDSTPAEAYAAGERARAAIAAIELPIAGQITASIGVSTGASTAVEDTIRQADAALYGAKEAGRNRVVMI